MKNIGFAAVIAGGIAAAALGFAGPAQAAASPEAPITLTSASFTTGIDHQSWLYDIRPNVSVPQVDNGVHQSR